MINDLGESLMAYNTIQVSNKGKQVSVPALNVNGTSIIVRGRWVKVAYIHDEAWLESEVADPEACITALRTGQLLADIFTFAQRLPPSPRYTYPMEWDNVAALPISNFEHWWSKQIDAKTRNMIRKAEKKGLDVREVPFDDVLVQGISAIYNECPTRQGKPFWHYGKDHEAVFRENASFLERSIMIGAYHEQTLVGFAKLVYDKAGNAGRSDADHFHDFAPG